MTSTDRLPVLYWFPAPYFEGPSRQTQLTAELSAHRRVLYLAERGADAGRRSSLEISEGLAQVTVLTIRVSRQLARLTRRAPLLAGVIRCRLVRRGLRSLGIRDYILHLGGPTRWLLVPLEASAVALDHIDPPFAESTAHRRNLQRIVSLACLVTATAESLETQVAVLGGNVARLPNAAEGAVLDATEHRDGAPDHGGVRVGYLGTVDSRFDSDLLDQVTRLAPDIEFLLAGRVNPDQAEPFRVATEQRDNVQVLGPLSQDEGERFLAGIDVGLVPFRENEIGDAINATKYYHYAAHGLPVVASDTREARNLSPHVVAVSGAEATVDAIRSVARDPEIRKSQAAFAAANTWSARATELDRLLAIYCDDGCGSQRLTLRSRWLT